MVGIRSRKDYDYTRTLVDMPLLAKDYYSSWATCEVTPTTSHVSLNLCRGVVVPFVDRSELVR
jgi:hypothetical protein